MAEATDKKTAGRKSASAIEAEPAANLAKALIDSRKAHARLCDVASKVLGEDQGGKLKELLEEGSLRPEVDRLARKLNALDPKEFSLIENNIEGHLQMIQKLKAN